MVFLRNRSRENSRDPSPEAPPPAPASSSLYPEVWNGETPVRYIVRSPWEWVMQAIATTSNMVQVPITSELFSSKLMAAATPATPSTRRRRNSNAKDKDSVCTLKIEIADSSTDNGDPDTLAFAAHGTSCAFDGMEDKDELVRTLQRCRCDHLNISPPSVLISWDATDEECLNVVGQELPLLKKNEDETKFAVLKEPMGSQGKGIYFVSTAEEIQKIINVHREKARNDPGYLDGLIEVKGRIPSWVLQAEVHPALLIKGRRKFHIRTYLVALEKLDHPDLVELYIFNRHEIRIAGVPVPEGDDESRDPVAHITNGALSTTTERVLLHKVDELSERHLEEKLEAFVAWAFGKHLLADISRRVSTSARQDQNSNGPVIRKFALAGLDLMVSSDNRIYLVEVNANPAAPRESTIDEDFKEHLKGFLHSLVDLVSGKVPPDFLSVQEILVRKGLADS